MVLYSVMRIHTMQCKLTLRVFYEWCFSVINMHYAKYSYMYRYYIDP